MLYSQEMGVEDLLVVNKLMGLSIGLIILAILGVSLIATSSNSIVLRLLLALVIIIAVVRIAFLLAQYHAKSPPLADDPSILRLRNQRKRLIAALRLKTSFRIREKALAQNLFQEVANEEILSPKLTIYAILNLIELLMEEVQAYGEQNLLLEAQRLLTRMYEIAQAQNSNGLAVEALLLLSRFGLLEGNMAKAEYLLALAATVAKEKSMSSKLGRRIAQEQLTMEQEYHWWEKLIAQATPLQQRLECAWLPAYIASAIRVIEREEEISDLMATTRQHYA